MPSGVYKRNIIGVVDVICFECGNACKKKRTQVMNKTFCNRDCYLKSEYAKTNRYVKGNDRSDIKGSNNVKWAGDRVSYRPLHAWVERTLGKPTKCSDCGEIKYGHSIHWANRSGQYKREVSDWIRLCAKCHGKYDKANKLRSNTTTQ